MSALEIAGVTVRPGERVESTLRVGARNSGSPIDVPIQVSAGRRAGPILWLQACIHGDEYDGVVAASRLAETATPDSIAGVLVVAPVVNISAFEHRVRASPLDHLDLNRVFPGRPEGTHTERLAWTLWQTLANRVDYCLDLHGGGNYFKVAFSAVFRDHPNEASRKAHMLARAIGVKVIKRDSEVRLAKSMFAQLTEQGIPAVIVESGGESRVTEDYVQRHVDGVLSAMRSIGMLEGEAPSHPEPRYVSTAIHATCDLGGFAWPVRSLLDEVVAGEPVVEIRDLYGRTVSVLACPFRKGLIIGLRTHPSVSAGEVVAIVAELV